MKTYQQAVERVVTFWVEKSFNTPFNQNNGDDSEHGGMAFMLMNLVAAQAQTTVSPLKIEAFRKHLTNSLLANESDLQKRTWLGVDYHPCELLADSAEFAGLNPGCFPCKTITRIDQNNNATAKYQYGGQWIEL